MAKCPSLIEGSKSNRSRPYGVRVKHAQILSLKATRLQPVGSSRAFLPLIGSNLVTRNDHPVTSPGSPGSGTSQLRCSTQVSSDQMDPKNSLNCSLSPGHEESTLEEHTGPLGFTTRANTKGSIRNSLRSNDAGQIPRPRNCCKLLKANQSDYEP